ncbi:hypothetical protein JCM17823_15050 [Halorubrum gandharaense]
MVDTADPATVLNVDHAMLVDPHDEETDVGDAAALVVVDLAGVDRVATSDAGVPVVALVDDPAGPVATAPVVDAVATEPGAVGAQIRWLHSRSSEPTRDEPRTDPARIERLHAGAARLASAHSAEEAYHTAIGIAEEVFSFHHCTIGVVDGEWVEPVASSSGLTLDDCNRVRMGAGVAGKTVASGDSHLLTDLDHDQYSASIAVPVGSDAVFQAVATDADAFADADLELAELLASHLEETLARLRADEELRTEHGRLVALFENVPDAAVEYDYVDGDPIVRRVNSAFETVFGYDAETVVGESVDDYIVPPAEAAIEEADELNRKLQAGENVRREVTRRTADGNRHFILHVIPLQLEAENLSGYAIYTDVTERREREAALRRQNEQLDEFSSIVSHDLRNPLSVAKGYANLARETEDFEHLDRVDAALDRMDELVSDLLALAREGRVVGDTETVSLADLAREAWASVDTGGAELRVEHDRTLEADPNRLRELLENLFRNSVEHGSTSSRAKPGDSVEHGSTSNRTESGDGDTMPPGSRDATPEPLTVTVGATEFRSDGSAGFYVEDDGAGFSGEDAERVFESGYTTSEDGTGLGLAISRHIADAHGWGVRAMAGESGGARFEFQTDG